MNLKTLILLFVVSVVSFAQKEPAAPAASDLQGRGTAPVLLQAQDEILVHSLTAKEIADKSFRLDQKGEVNFPLIGRISLTGKTIPEAEQILESKLQQFYVNPEVELNISAVHSETVSVIGAVGAPGVKPIQNDTTLIEALSSAGGVQGNAGPILVITRDAKYGPIPHTGARLTESGSFVAEIDLRALLSAKDPKENLRVQPHDVISVPTAQIVYVAGNVNHPGGFPLDGRSSITVLQAVALAAGLDTRAAPQRSRILRRNGESKEQIQVDLKKVLAGKSEDIILRPDDILFIPSSTTKVVTARAIEAAIGLGSSIAVYGRF